MKATSRIIIALLAASGTAFAASSAEFEANGFLATFFLAFGALIIVFQLAPGLFLFGSMLKGLFSHPVDEIPLNTHRGER